MKKTKIIIPALGMLLLSTAASVTGTVAWFSMSNYVTATNLNIKAKAENGIVIANEGKSEWKEKVNASHAAAIAVRPTSTATGATWCHSTSNDANDENTGNPYTMISPALGSNGAGYLDDNGSEGYQPADTGEDPNIVPADSAYYLLNSFYIQSSAEALSKPIYVTDVVATAGSSSPDLDKAVRVLIRSGSGQNIYSLVYAPIAGADLSYDVCTAWNEGDNPLTTGEDEVEDGYPTLAHVTAINPAAAGNAGKNQTLLPAASIPAFTAAGTNAIKIDVYLYFEGEDSNCMSANVTSTLDQISVSVTFGTALKTFN